MRGVKTSKARAGRSPEDRYGDLKKELQSLGYVCVGSITHRKLKCGKASCVCHRDPSKLHGPYYYWTRKVKGQTESRFLSQSLVRLYARAIRNHQNLDDILIQMREVSLLAFEDGKRESP